MSSLSTPAISSPKAGTQSASVSPEATPNPSPRPDPLLTTKTLKNTVLKSHGRPPWQVLFSPSFLGKETEQVGVHDRYGEDGLPICQAFVIGIAGTFILPLTETITYHSAHCSILICSTGGSASGKV